jgi:hypothetical protein
MSPNSTVSHKDVRHATQYRVCGAAEGEVELAVSGLLKCVAILNTML